jgi:hypothetical protein
MVAKMRSATAFVTVLAAAVLASLAMAPSSLGAPKPPTAPALDSVSFSGTADAGGPLWRMQIQAQSGPNGENPTGHVTVDRTDTGFLFFDGPVTCLAVRGSVATLNVQTTQFDVVTMEMTDEGPGAQESINAIPSGREPTDCSPFSFGLEFVVRSGDIRVVDAPPAPTSKDDCRNGGYARFGFRNQGQCVAAVVHRPKP